MPGPLGLVRGTGLCVQERIDIVGDFRLENVPVSKLTPGPHQHPPFSEELRESLRQIQAAFQDVRPMTLVDGS
jgi:hypothetical protein